MIVRAVLLIQLLLLAACTAPQYRVIDQDRGDLPLRATVDNVPFYPQEDYYCGPASLAMVLSWAGIPTTQEKIATQVYTPGRKGTLPSDILSGARRNGALAVRVDSLHDLLAEIAAGHPVLVFQNLGLPLFPQWHFAVAFEYDLSQETIVLHSGLDARRTTGLNTFEHTWQRADYWAITVTSPPQLPATAGSQAVLEAAAGLERAGQYEAATRAYKAIAERWEQNATALIGLGNTYYAAGNFKQSAAAFRKAISIDGSNAPAWNNLAYALAKLNQRQASLEAAERAIDISGNDKAYQQTLIEIRQMLSEPAP